MKNGTSSLLSASSATRFAAVAAGAALLLRFLRLFSEFQYDEWWTLLRFSPLSVTQILTDLSLPNNHPVNTLVLKALSAFSIDFLWLRSGVFLVGTATLFLAAHFAAALRGKWAAAATLWLLGLSAPLLLYSTTARGYIYQLLGLMLCADALRHFRQEVGRKKTFFPEAELVSGGILSFLSLSTGILWLFLLGGGFLLLAPAQIRRNPPLWRAAGLLAAVAALYYGVNFSAILAGSRWGTAFPSLFSRLVYFGKTLFFCGLPFFAPWLLAAVWSDRQKTIVLLLTFLPPLIFSCSTGGPERIYLPMIAAWALLAAFGFARALERFPRQSVLFCAALVLTAAALFYPLGPWQPETPASDWHGAPRTEKTVVVLRSSAGYPALLNDPQISGQWAAMLAHAPDTLCLVGGTPGTINGADADFAECEIELPDPPREEKGNCRIYSLSRQNFPEAGRCYLIISTRPQEDAALFSPAGKLLTLNLFFPSPGKRVFAWKCGEVPPNLFTGERLFYLIGEKK